MEIDTWGRAQGQQSQSRLTWASGGKLGNQEGVSKIEKRLGRILGFEMYCKWATSHAPPLRPFWSIPKKTNINTVFPILLPDFWSIIIVFSRGRRHDNLPMVPRPFFEAHRSTAALTVRRHMGVALAWIRIASLGRNYFKKKSQSINNEDKKTDAIYIIKKIKTLRTKLFTRKSTVLSSLRGRVDRSAKNALVLKAVLRWWVSAENVLVSKNGGVWIWVDSRECWYFKNGAWNIMEVAILWTSCQILRGQCCTSAGVKGKTLVDGRWMHRHADTMLAWGQVQNSLLGGRSSVGSKCKLDPWSMMHVEDHENRQQTRGRYEQKSWITGNPLKTRGCNSNHH